MLLSRPISMEEHQENDSREEGTTRPVFRVPGTEDLRDLLSTADLPKFRNIFRCEESLAQVKSLNQLLSDFVFPGVAQSELIFRPQIEGFKHRIPPFDHYTGKLSLEDGYGVRRKHFEVYPVGVEDHLDGTFTWSWEGDQLAQHPPFTAIRTYLDEIKGLAETAQLDFLREGVVEVPSIPGLELTAGEIAAYTLLALNQRDDCIGVYSITDAAIRRNYGEMHVRNSYTFLVREEGAYNLNLSNLGDDDVSLQVLKNRFPEYLSKMGPPENFNILDAFQALGTRLGLDVDTGSDYAYARPFEDLRERAITISLGRDGELGTMQAHNV